MSCWHRLSISTHDALRPDWSLPQVSDQQVWQVPALELFQPAWLDRMHEAGLPISVVLLFYKPAWFSHTMAHVDMFDETSMTVFGLNWVLGQSEGQMRWYDMPEGDDPVQWAQPVNFTKINSPYKHWPITELTEIDRCPIEDQLTLVRTDRPHAIFTGRHPRWCISARFVDPDRLPWEQVVAKYQHLIA